MLLEENPVPLDTIVYLLEGLRTATPNLFNDLLQRASPYFSPADACQSGVHVEVSIE